MSLYQLSSQLPEYAVDIQANLEQVLLEVEESLLSETQRWLLAYAAGMASSCPALVAAVQEDAEQFLTDALQRGARLGNSLHAMQGMYHHFTHMVSQEEYHHKPMRLRLNSLSQCGLMREEHELIALAGSLMRSDWHAVRKHAQGLDKCGFSPDALQECVRIVACIRAIAEVSMMECYATTQ
jgi:hypothetical protein